MKRWLSGAKIVSDRCKVNGALATGIAGVLSTATNFEDRIRSRLNAAGATSAIADAWNDAFRSAWHSWANAVTIPALSWFPSFPMYPGAGAFPIPAPDTPLAAFLSAGVVQMQSSNLQARIASALQQVAEDQPGRADAVMAFSTAVGAKFNNVLGLVVSNIGGAGPVPSYNPPSVVAGPVTNGQCSGVNVLPGALSIF
jgi:hypothetical protein